MAGSRSPTTTARRGWKSPSPPLADLAVAKSSVERAPVSVADARRTAADINAFGLDLYRRLLKDPKAKLDGKGVVMSPTSIATALAMARAGATGRTASQMDDVLRANGWGDLGSGLGSLEQILNGYNATWEDDEGTRHALSLNMVNRAFGQDGWTIQETVPRSDRERLRGGPRARRLHR